MKMMAKGKIYKRAINEFGETTQLGVAQEECAELIAALSKYFRGDVDAIPKVQEEIADVEIMLEQLRMIFDRKGIDKAKKTKIQRLHFRILSREVESHERRAQAEV